MDRLREPSGAVTDLSGRALTCAPLSGGQCPGGQEANLRPLGLQTHSRGSPRLTRVLSAQVSGLGRPSPSSPIRRRSERVAVPVTALLPALGRVPLRRGPCAGLHLAAWPCAAHDRLIQDGSRSGSSCSSLRGLPTENLTISRAAPKAAAERHAFVLTYLSDLSSGGGEHSAERGPRTATGPDDAVWFRRPVRMDA